MGHELFTFINSIILSLWTATGKARPSTSLVMLELGAGTVVILTVMDGIETMTKPDPYPLKRVRKLMMLGDEEK